VVYKMVDDEDSKTENHEEDDTYNLILIGIPKI
jgi:hypothetical protein